MKKAAFGVFALALAQPFRVEEAARGLEVPWALAFLPDGGMLVTEQPGRIRLVRMGQVKTYLELPVYARGESGLLGLALHPAFPRTPYVYVYRTLLEGSRLRNQVLRLRHRGERGWWTGLILDGIPAAEHGLHLGGRIAFGPDGYLYVTTGEIYQRELAQDLSSLGGEDPPDRPRRAARARQPFPRPAGDARGDLLLWPPKPPGLGLGRGHALFQRAWPELGKRL